MEATVEVEKLYELKKDIISPEGYLRAGITKTKSEWVTLFPSSFSANFIIAEWFICVEGIEEQTTVNPDIITIVRDVFVQRGLRSVSYEMAAVRCIEIYRDKYL